MVIALTEPIQEQESLHLEVNISTDLSISSQQAKRKLTRYFMDHVSLFFMPGKPLLVILAGNRIVWRFPVIFSPGHQLGQVGEVDVDAQSGELIINKTNIAEMIDHANRLAQVAPLPAES